MGDLLATKYQVVMQKVEHIVLRILDLAYCNFNVAFQTAKVYLSLGQYAKTYFQRSIHWYSAVSSFQISPYNAAHEMVNSAAM